MLNFDQVFKEVDCKTQEAVGGCFVEWNMNSKTTCENLKQPPDLQSYNTFLYDTKNPPFLTRKSHRVKIRQLQLMISCG